MAKKINHLINNLNGITINRKNEASLLEKKQLADKKRLTRKKEKKDKLIRDNNQIERKERNDRIRKKITDIR